MCLGIPGEVLSIEEHAQGMRKARVRFGGIISEVNLDLLPEAQVGDYVVVHVLALRNGVALPRPLELHLKPAGRRFRLLGVRH